MNNEAIDQLKMKVHSLNWKGYASAIFSIISIISAPLLFYLWIFCYTGYKDDFFGRLIMIFLASGYCVLIAGFPIYLLLRLFISINLDSRNLGIAEKCFLLLDKMYSYLFIFVVVISIFIAL